MIARDGRVLGGGDAFQDERDVVNVLEALDLTGERLGGLVDGSLKLKAAFLASEAAGSPFSDRDVVAMATRGAAAILKWEKVLGSLEAGKRADVLVLEGTRGDPYRRLLSADERSIRLLLINGVPRMGLPSLMASLGANGESIRVGGRLRILNLKQRTADPVVGGITLADARDTLKDALRRLPELAREQEAAPERAGVPGRAVASEPLTWFLALDELADFGRPKRISLCVLVDRGGRELPIQADIVGHTVKTRPDDRIEVQVQELDGRDGVDLVRGQGA